MSAKQTKSKSCDHPDYVFDYQAREHVCECCRLVWSKTGQPMESKSYVFDRLLGEAWL